jgi:hypothetical protein
MKGIIKILKKRLILAGVSALLLASFSSPAMADWVGWLAKIRVSYANDENKIVLGAAPDAVDGFESRYAGRALLQGYIMTYFHHPEWGDETPYFTRDMRSIYLPQEWTFYVSSRFTNKDMEIRWDTSRVQDTITLVLEDVTTGGKVLQGHGRRHVRVPPGTRATCGLNPSGDRHNDGGACIHRHF